MLGKAVRGGGVEQGRATGSLGMKDEIVQQAHHYSHIHQQIIIHNSAPLLLGELLRRACLI